MKDAKVGGAKVRSRGVGTQGLKPVAATRDWFAELVDCLRRRSIAEGTRLLDRTEPAWRALEPKDKHGAEVLLLLAQWVDVGYRDAQLLRERLDTLKGVAREELGVAAYVRVRMTEAFYALSNDDADGAIRILGSLLVMEDMVLDAELRALANLWKGRAHRKKADYDMAREHLGAALEIAKTLPESDALVAITKIQQAWIIFQYGDSAGALQMLSEAEKGLKKTDHWIALGNIESARGRIVRRHGDYARAVTHFERAVALYEISHPNHTNLARAMTNLSFVKRLLARDCGSFIGSIRSCTGARLRNWSGRSRFACCMENTVGWGRRC